MDDHKPNINARLRDGKTWMRFRSFGIITNMIVAAADGSALSNPGPAGWAWYVSDDVWAAGGWEHGTNNMAELMAVLDLLQSTADADQPLRVLCDSQYVINSLTKWLPGWKRRGWKKGDGKPVLNVELMKQLDHALQGREVEFEWVKGHAGHRMNERADELARGVATALQSGQDFVAGPGFAAATPSARGQSFDVGARDEEPDLFSFAAEEPAPTRPGNARLKATLTTLTREILSDQVRMDADRLAGLLHPDFIAHSVDGDVVAADHGAWQPTSQEFEVLGVDEYAPDLAGMRWRHNGNLRFSLWQKLPSGWKLRFAQVTPG